MNYSQELANRCFLATKLDFAVGKNALDLLVGVFPSSIDIYQASHSAWVVIFDSRTEKDRQLWTKTRALEGGTVELQQCPPNVIPDHVIALFRERSETPDSQTQATPPPSYSQAIEDMSQPPSFGSSTHEKEPVSITEDSQDDVSSTVKVSDLPTEANEEFLELYFSNAKKGGGGKVKSVTINKDQSFALVEFLTPEGVVKTIRKRPHEILGKVVSVERYVHMSSENGEYIDKCKVIVTGLTKEMSDDLIHLYFEHPRKSGGGEIANFKRVDDGTALITFVKEKDVEKVLSRESHIVNKTTLTVRRWEKPKEKTIKVTGLKASCSEDMLDLYFSNPDKSGGGDIETVKILDDGVTALVTFSKEQDCKEVLKRSDKHKLSGTELTVSLFNEVKEKQRVVEVSGFSSKHDREFMDLLFDKVTKSDGCIEDMKILSPASVLLTFKSAEDAEKIVRSAAENGLKWKGRPLRANWPSTTVDQPCIEIEEDPDSIIVSGIPESDNLKFHFANKRKSGGGKISLMTTQEDGTVLIQFEDPSVVPKVLSQEHTVLGRKLTVREYQPLERVRIDPRKLFIDNISLKTKDHTLILFVEDICDYEPETVVWGTAHQSAMVLFKEEIDAKTLQKSCKGKQLDGNTLTLKAVPVSRCLRVTGFSEQTTEDHLRFYFSNKKKSDGGPVTQVTISEEGAYALVHFKDYSVAERVMNKSHTLDEQDLFLDIHYECLGLVSVIGNVAPLMKPGNIQHEISVEMAGFFKHSKANWNALESELKTIGSDVKLTFGEQPSLILSCTLERTEPNRGKLIIWQDTAKKSVEGFLSMYAQMEVNCSKETWNDIKNGLADDKFSLKEGGTISLKEHKHLIMLTGQKQIIEEGYRHVTDMKKKVEEDFDRKRKSITENKIEDPHKLFYLKMLKFEQTASESHHVKVKFHFDQNTIELYGLPGDVTKCKVTLYEILNDLKSSTLTLTQSICSMLSNSTEMKKVVSDRFKKSNLTAVWKCDSDRVTVFSQKMQDVDKGKEIIKETLKEEELKLKPEEGCLLCLPEWHEFMKRILNESEGLVNIIPASNNSSITLVAVTHKGCFDKCKEAILMFLKQNTIWSEPTPVDTGRLKFIKKYEQECIRQLEQNTEGVKSINVNVETSKIIIRGTEDGIGKVRSKIEELIKQIKSESYNVYKPGHKKLLTSEKGMNLMRDVEKGFKVIVENNFEKGPGVRSREQSGDFKTKSRKQVFRKSTFNIDERRTVIVMVEDITEVRADVIVNAANGDLKHIGGVARQILVKGGRIIQEESDVFVREEGPLSDGEVTITSAGSLPCKAVIHAVGPRWNGGNQQEDKSLRKAVWNSLSAAADNEFTSIAMPALSTGVFAYPLREASDIIISTIQLYFKRNPGSSLNQLIMVVSDDQVFSSFTSVLSKVYPNQDMMEVEPSPIPQESGRRMSETLEEEEDGVPTVITTASQLQIHLVEGELSKQNVDVLVNSANGRLRLQHGAISASLLRVAGPSLQTEVNDNYPKGLTSSNDVAITRGYGLNCTAVFHGALVQWGKNQNGRKALRNMVQKCLKLAEQSSYSSIAFPALGTGNLSFPDDVVASEMFDTVRKFKSNSLKDVYFVVYPASKSTVQAFRREASKSVTTPKMKSNRRGRKQRNFDNKVEKETFLIENITFSVKQGDITDSTMDAIVNGSNADLDLTQGATSKAILKKGGEMVEEECKQLAGQMKKNGIVRCRGGNLHCKHIIHVCVDKNSPWEKVMYRCLEAADELKLKSVAFPALGTGVLKVTPEDLIKHLFKAIVKFQNQAKSSISIKEVELVVYQSDMVDKIKKQLLKCFEKGEDQQPSFVKSVYQGAKNFFGFKSEDTESKSTEANNLCLVILSSNKEDIKKTVERLDGFFKQEELEKSIPGSWKEIIQEMGQQEEMRVKKITSENHVSMDFQRTQGQIKLQGINSDVIQAYDQIMELLKKVSDNSHEKKASELVAAVVQWYYIDTDDEDGATDGSTRVKYDENTNRQIEEAFSSNKKDFSLLSDDNVRYRYDFDTMEEYVENSSEDRVKLIRKVLHVQGSAYEPPPTWKNMDDKDMLTVILNPTDSEYKAVASSLNGLATIIQIERVQNISLYQQYMAYKGKMERANGNQNVEQSLWHGTSVETVPSINHYGFNRSYCGKNATAFGNGVYFARDPQYSMHGQYSRPDSKGQKRMYHCKVLIGKYTQGRSGMVAPPALNGHILYDSVVDNPTSPGIFVVFQDAQAYPEYLITFQ